MRRGSAAFMVVAGLTCVALSRTAVAESSGGTRIFDACRDPGGVRVSGHATSEGLHRDGALPIAAGAIRFVQCGDGVLATLRSLGDATADGDAGLCTLGQAPCDATSKIDHKPRVTAIRLVKQADGTWQSDGAACVIAAKPSVTPQMVIDRAARLIPTAAIGVAPKAATLVNMQTIMWVEAPAKQTLPTARILGKQVRITIVLDHVNWSFGDGRTDTTTNPGKRYDGVNDTCETRLCPDYYGHIYTNKGRTTLTATAAWRATFTVGTGPPTAIPGTINGPTARSPIRVREARAVLVDNPHN